MALGELNKKIEEQKRLIQESQPPTISFLETKATKEAREAVLEVAEQNLRILEELKEGIDKRTFSPLKLKKKKKPSSPLKKKKSKKKKSKKQ